MVNRYVFQRLMALTIRHLQSKTIRDPVTPGQRERVGGALIHYWWKRALAQLLRETVAVPRKLKTSCQRTLPC